MQQINYTNEKVLEGSLHLVLEKFYSAASLWDIMTGLVYPMQNQNPPNKKPAKIIMIETLESMLESEESCAPAV